MKEIIKENKNLLLEFIFGTIFAETAIKIFRIKNNSIYVVLIVLAIIFLIDKILKNKEYFKNKIEVTLLTLYSLAISAIIVIQSKITFKGEVGLSYLENTFSSFEKIDMAKFFIIFIGAVLIFINLGIWIKNNKFTIFEEKDNKKISNKTEKKYWIVFTILTAIPFLLYLLTYAPGTVLRDSMLSIIQGLGIAKFNNHHPVVYSIFVGFFMRIGRVLNNYNIGVMLYSVVQLLIMSGIIGYFLVWLKKHNVKMEYILLTYLFFVANTVFASYAITMWKDPLFSGFVFLMTLYIFDIIEQNGEPLKKISGIIKFVILSLLIAFFRNNGIYIIIGMYLTLLIWSKKNLLKFNIVNTITVIAILVIQGPVYTKLGIVSPAEEALGIPMQQIARTVAYDGNITQEQEEFLNKILPIEKWKIRYEPCLVDSIKCDSNFDTKFLADHKVEFLKVWAQMLPSNFKEYVKAYLMNTYGFWSIEIKNRCGFVDTYITINNLRIKKTDIIKNATGMSMKKVFSTPDFLGSGTLLWITILSGIILIMNKKQKYLFVLLPCMISWLSIMVATPVAFSLRYVFMMVYALPLIIMLPFITKKMTIKFYNNGNKNENSSINTML